MKNGAAVARKPVTSIAARTRGGGGQGEEEDNILYVIPMLAIHP
jgi:hypothetical protein